MTWVQRKLSDLRNRPYAERIRILKIGVVLVGIIMIAIWGLTLRYRTQHTTAGGSDKFKPLLDNLKNLKQAWPKFQPAK